MLESRAAEGDSGSGQPRPCHPLRRLAGLHGLVDVGYARHLRVNHGDDQFVDGRSHINGIERFWTYTKHRFTKFKAVARPTRDLHLKEIEFRFNHHRDHLYRVVLKLLREQPI